MKKSIMLLIVMIELVSNVSAANPTYSKGYLLRSAVTWPMYAFDKNNNLICNDKSRTDCSFTGATAKLLIPDDAFPIKVSQCNDPYNSQTNSDCKNGYTLRIATPGCYVIWKDSRFVFPPYFYTYSPWWCAVG